VDFLFVIVLHLYFNAVKRMIGSAEKNRKKQMNRKPLKKPDAWFI